MSWLCGIGCDARCPHDNDNDIDGYSKRTKIVGADAKRHKEGDGDRHHKQPCVLGVDHLRLCAGYNPVSNGDDVPMHGK